MKIAIGQKERVRPTLCLRCGHLLDARRKAGSIETELEKAGDASVCSYCGNVAIFAEDLSLREPTAEERAVLDEDAELRLLVEQIRLNPRRE
jgi:DNA-directed RNA polymerase subunit RPC12/RpoP